MKDTQLYRQILSIEKPWKVIDEMVSPQDDEVKVIVEQCASGWGIAFHSYGQFSNNPQREAPVAAVNIEGQLTHICGRSMLSQSVLLSGKSRPTADVS